MSKHKRIKSYTVSQQIQNVVDLDLRLAIKCFFIQGISVLSILASLIWCFLKLSKTLYLNSIILNSISFCLSIFIFYFMSRILINQKRTVSIKLIVPIIFIAAILTSISSGTFIFVNFIQNFQPEMLTLKPSICPDYSTNITGILNGKTYTGCFCKDLFGYTLLHYQTTGMKCCDCPFHESCNNFDSNRCLTNQKSKESLIYVMIGGICSIISGICQLIVFAFFIYKG